MKRCFYLITCALLLCYSCNDIDDGYKTYSISAQLVYPENSKFGAAENVRVRLTSSNGTYYYTGTDALGKGTFNVPAGIYDVSVTDVRSVDGRSYIYSGVKSRIAMTNTWTGAEHVELLLRESQTSQIVIKELYVGGCQKDDGSGVFQMDKYAIIYNNSNQVASYDNLCLGMVLPYNANSTNNDYVNGSLIYDKGDESWIPAGCGIWYFPNNVIIEPYKQIVVALTNAVDNTRTYSNSINFNNSDYYCTYDILSYTNTTYYPSPADAIPTSHYLSAVHYGAGNAWPLSTTSPAFFLFETKESTPVAFANNADNTNYHGDKVSDANRRKKVPIGWIVDGVEVFTTTSDKNQKRLTASVDVGQIYLKNQIGYSLYRNVNVEMTMAIEGNELKLVYGYDKGTIIGEAGSTDPSGIDAEASIKNGAKIIYMDTNNSTDDFHQRKQASLRD